MYSATQKGYPMNNRMFVDKVKVRENRLRRKAARLEIVISKSRGKLWGIDNQLGYMLIDPSTNAVIDGGKYDLDLDEVEKFLDDYEKRLIEESKKEG